MFKLLLLAAFIPALAFARTPVNNCPGQPAPTAVDIIDCDVQPCRLVRGTPAEMLMTFTAEAGAVTLVPRARATVLGLVVPYDLPADVMAACSNLIGSTCPVDAGEEITWRLLFPITDIYPTISLNIELALLDGEGNMLSCFNVDAQVVAA